ncbi:hypothetical protein [Microcoleus sp. B4-D4]|uniref:hypothetical protein n=1 Tax=Microcoleus sp. B4-D4 TaxID=2818667 RepID=UPI002FD138D9
MSVGRRKFGNEQCTGCNGCNGCKSDVRRKKEEGRRKKLLASCYQALPGNADRRGSTSIWETVT